MHIRYAILIYFLLIFYGVTLWDPIMLAIKLNHLILLINSTTSQVTLIIQMMWINMPTNSWSLKHKNMFCVNYLPHDILIIAK
jgi:hypothetical protein